MLKKVLRVLGIVLIALVALIVIAIAGVFIASEGILNKTYVAPTPVIAASTDAAVIARGQHLLTAVSACGSCHGANMAGGVVVDDPALGRIVAPNLTRGTGGQGDRLSDADMARAIRYAVLPDGKSARVMPSMDYNHLSNEDLTAIISYIRSLPPVDNDMPGSQMGMLGRILMATGQLPIMIADRIDLHGTPAAMPAAGVTPENGKYLADIAGCTDCHGAGLSGGKVPGTPPDYPIAANLTPSGEVAGWTEAMFIQTVRTGKNPGGHMLASVMPYDYYRNMSDDELQAIWLFVKSVPARPAGSR